MRDPDDDNEAEMKTPRPNQILLCLSASVITFESLPIKLIIIIGHQTIFFFSFFFLYADCSPIPPDQRFTIAEEGSSC